MTTDRTDVESGAIRLVPSRLNDPDIFAATSSEEPEPTARIFSATLTIVGTDPKHSLTVDVTGSSRIVDLVLHSASDAFRENAEG